MVTPERKYQSGAASYRYSINGQEKEPELNENITTALYWEYDSRIGKRWNMDPRPDVSISPYAVFGNNPIGFSDPLGDTLRGINQTSAMRIQETITETVDKISTAGCEKIMSYFKIGSDKVSYEKIDQAAFDKTTSELNLSDDAKALLNGYVQAINDNNTHFVSITKPGETIDVTKAKNITSSSIKLFSGLLARKQGDGIVNPRDAAGGQKGGQSLTAIQFAQFNPGNFHPQNKSLVPPRAMILAHTLIGHNLADFYFREMWDKKITARVQSGEIPIGQYNLYKNAPVLELKTFSNLSAIQMNNVYLKAMNIKMEDYGEDHNRANFIGAPPGPPMDATKRVAIPEYLKR